MKTAMDPSHGPFAGDDGIAEIARLATANGHEDVPRRNAHRDRGGDAPC